MCLAIPAEIETIGNKHACVKCMGVKQNVNIQLLDSLTVGDFVLIHAGFAIKKINTDDFILLEGVLKEMLKE